MDVDLRNIGGEIVHTHQRHHLRQQIVSRIRGHHDQNFNDLLLLSLRVRPHLKDDSNLRPRRVVRAGVRVRVKIRAKVMAEVKE